MMRKHLTPSLLAVALLLSVPSAAFSQFTPASTDGARLSFTTNKDVGASIQLIVNASSKNVWIDLNGDKTCQDGEMLPLDSDTSVKIATQNLVIYGDLTRVIASKSGITTIDLANVPNLELLDCKGNRLTALDISKNPKLRMLYCAQNGLTTLDVSKNLELQRLSCGENSLTTLDVSDNSKLLQLACGKNKLTALDVSKNTDLESFWSFENALTALDVSKNTKLQQFSCGENKLTALDVSKNVDLQELYCAVNALTSLDVSENSKLYLLSCGENKLTSLDVSKSPDLERLYCYENALALLDVGRNLNLQLLSCGSNRLTALDVSENSALLQLYCAQNRLSVLDVSKNGNLKGLYCYENQIKEVEMQKIVDALPTCIASDRGDFRPYNPTPSSTDNEENLCFDKQVAIAKEKYWKVLTPSGEDFPGLDGTDEIVDALMPFAIAVETGNLRISGLGRGTPIAICQLDGSVVYRGAASGGEECIALAPSSSYLLYLGYYAAKVVVP